MKAVGDLLIVILMAIIVWGITALVLIILSVNILVPNAAAVTSMAVATVTAIAFVAFCIKGRSVSKKESRTDSPKMISDFTVFRDYCATLAELDTTDYIYLKNEFSALLSVFLSAKTAPMKCGLAQR